MQQIERYGVIALVFLLVTIVAVSFWGDSKSPGFWSRLTGKSDGKKEQTDKPTTPLLVSDHVVDPNLPLSGANAPAGTNVPVTPLANGNTPSATDTPSLGSATIQPPESLSSPLAPGTAVPLAGAVQNHATLAGVKPAETVIAPIVHNEYVVQKGDSLARIAAKNLGNENLWRDIQDANPGLDPKKLTVGQKLVLPLGASAANSKATSTAKLMSVATTKAPVEAPKVAKASPPKSSASKGANAAGYTVKKGDHLASIAQAELGSSSRWKEIVAANPGLDPDKLVVGQTIHLPGGAVAERRPVLAAAVASAGKPRVR